SSANPSDYGQAVTFTATVHTGPVTATGNVEFLDATTVIGTGPLSAGVATFTTSSLASGAHSIRARYNGDPSNGGSTSPVLLQSVAAAVDTPASTPEGQAVTIEVTTAVNG